jgi:hypothetical protein
MGRFQFLHRQFSFLPNVAIFHFHLHKLWCLYLVADSVCKSLFDIRSVFDSRQSTDKQVDVTGVSTVLFKDSFPQILRLLQQSSWQYNLPIGQMQSDVFHTSR